QARVLFECSTEKHFAGEKTHYKIRTVLELFPVGLGRQSRQMLAHPPCMCREIEAARSLIWRAHRVEKSIERRLHIDHNRAIVRQLDDTIRPHCAVFYPYKNLHIERGVLHHARKFNAALQLQLTPVAAHLRRSQS